MNYTLHQLQIFSKVVELKSITRASEELNMTQPAVSIQLKNLQSQFEIPLTEVVGRQLYVTEFGMEIYKMSERIIDEMDAINHRTAAFKGNITGRLKIAIVSTGKYVMPFFLTDFLNVNPNIDLIMDVTNKQKVITSLEENEVDFALVSLLPETIKCNTESLLENQLYVIANKKVSIENKKITKKQLSEMPLLFREEGSGTRLVMEKYFKIHNITVRKKMELTSNEAVKQAVLAGLGNSIMPLIGIRYELLNKELIILPTQGFPINSKWQLIWLKGKKLSPAADAYINFIKNNKEQILKNHFSWIPKVIVNA